MIDAMSLLRRYMQHIVNEESVSYVSEVRTAELRELFSEEEITLLRQIAKEVEAKDA